MYNSDPVRSQCQLQTLISSKDQSRLHQFDFETMLTGIFMGFVSCAGGGWSGDWFVADCEDWETPVNFRNPKAHQMKHKTTTPSFTCAEGTLKICAGKARKGKPCARRARKIRKRRRLHIPSSRRTSITIVRSNRRNMPHFFETRRSDEADANKHSQRFCGD